MSDPQVKDSEQVNRRVVQFGKHVTIRLDQPLPRFNNGSSEAYVAYNEIEKKKKFFVLVAGSESLARWRHEKKYNSLGDPSFIRLMGTGIVQWPLDGQQKYVFLYQAEFGECLVKEGEFSNTQWGSAEVNKFLIEPMARMLKDLRDRGLCHGCIRSDTIFYGSAEKDSPVILGDCLSVHTMSTQRSLFLPIDKALVDPMGRGEGTSADDVYAFGVSLALFLRKTDEIGDLSDEALLRQKIEVGSFAAIVGAERFQGAILDLLRGVLNDDANARWKVEDIFSWLEGARVTPAPLPRRQKAIRPISFMGRKYIFADVLAIDLHKSPGEAIEMVKNGQLSEWIDKSLSDRQMLMQFETILDRVGDVSTNASLLIAHLKMLFNPMLPIHYKDKIFTYDGIGGILAFDAMKGQDLSVYEEVITLSLPDYAIAERNLSSSNVKALVRLYDQCRLALKQKKRGQGIERCIYILCDHAPCLSPRYRDYFINSAHSALVTFEKLSDAGGQIALYMDEHCIAFFSNLSSSMMNQCMYDLNSSEKDDQIAGNLRCLALMQREIKGFKAMAIASVFRDSLSGVYKSFQNKGLRIQVEEGVKRAAAKGDLIAMSAILDDESTLRKDKRAFQRAQSEFKLLQAEYNQYTVRLKNKKMYGVVNGRDAAPLVSWSVSTLITVMVVIAFLSGYQIF